MVTRALRRYAGDAVVPAVLVGVTLVQPFVLHDGPYGRPSVPGMGISALTCVTLLVRRRWPLPVLAATVGGTLAAVAVSGALSPVWVSVAVAAYAVAARASQTTALIADAAAALLVLITGVVLLSGGEWSWPNYVTLVAWPGMGGMAGYAVRSRQAYVRAVEDRALRAEQSREDEARRRVAEERLRVARDVHDVVAHHIALINVQAGVAAHMLRAQPEAAQQALGHVRQAGRTVLDELGTLLGMLRQPGDPPEPTPSLAALDRLIASFAVAGLSVRRSVSGLCRPVPAATGQAAYRVVQESLTNAHRHGDGAEVHLHITYAANELIVVVRNQRCDSATVPEHDGGLGILGMRERVAAVGGRFSAGPEPGGGFCVRAGLPLPSRVDG